jgi:predicted membrane protein DUF2142
MAAPAPVRALVIAFLALTTLAWVYAIPPGAGYDEVAHYVKALGVGRAQLWGTPDKVHAEDRLVKELGRVFGPKKTPAARSPSYDWLVRTRREFDVPPNLAVTDNCAERSPSGCVRGLRATGRGYARSYVGTYAPFFYLLPGLATRKASSPSQAVRRGRLATAALCVALLALTALMLLREPRSELALVGLVAAVSPAVLYVAATINPSGPEITAAPCFGAALIAAADPRLAGRTYPWVTAAFAGAVLAACRPLGPAFVLLTLVAVGALVGREAVRGAVRADRRRAIAAAGAVALAAVLNLAWELSRQPHPHLTKSDIRPGLSEAWEALPSLGKQLVGSFGSFDLNLPLIGYLAWAGVVLTVLGLALRVGSARERVVLIGLTAATPILVFVLSVTQRPTGFGVQTRYVLPVAALALVLAGEVLRVHRESISRELARIVLVGVCGVAAAVHVTAWVAAASGWDKYINDPVEPPGGWLPWAIVASAGAAALAALGLVARTPGRRPLPPRVHPR